MDTISISASDWGAGRMRGMVPQPMLAHAVSVLVSRVSVHANTQADHGASIYN